MLHEAIKFLRDAVDSTATGGIRSCYVMRPGMIYARNMALQAGMPWDGDVELNIPAAPLNLALGRMRKIAPPEIDGNTIKIKSGRLSSTIKCDTLPMPQLPPLPSEWLDYPKGLIEALKLALPFMGEGGWQAGVRLMNGRVTAFDKAIGIDIEVPELRTPAIILTRDIAEFLIGQDQPTCYASTEYAITFRWQDDRWVRAQLIVDKFPEHADTLFPKLDGKKAVEIDDGWRDAYGDAVALGDGFMHVTRSGFRVRKDNADSVIDWPMEILPKDHDSYWDKKYLGRLAGCATLWDPQGYPNACAFSGPNFRGVIVGVRQ